MGKLQKDEAFYKKLWSLMVPIVLQNLMLAMVAVADAFMLGGMDQNYMSAVSLATQIQFIQNMFLSAATASLGILGAQYWGKGDKQTVERILGLASRVVILISLIFFSISFFFPGAIMRLFTSSPETIHEGIRYLRVLSFSFISFITSFKSMVSSKYVFKLLSSGTSNSNFGNSFSSILFLTYFFIVVISVYSPLFLFF